jgi:pullulanase/glycogen debranching enzyme
MAPRDQKIAKAHLDDPRRGIVELSKDWRGRQIPPVSLGPDGPAFETFTKLADDVFGCESGYFVNRKGEIFFVLDPRANSVLSSEKIYLAGDFNGWQAAVGQSEWELKPDTIHGTSMLVWAGPRAERFFHSPPFRFKFVTGEHRWLPVPSSAPNQLRDQAGNVNRVIEPERTGQHLFQFTLKEPLDISKAWSVFWSDLPATPLRCGDFFFKLASDRPLGALVNGSQTTFRLFAPRATKVTVFVCDDLAQKEKARAFALTRQPDHTWEVDVPQNLHGFFYWYSVDGPKDAFTGFDPAQPILDPYARAAVDRDGPGIVLAPEFVGRASRHFQTPAWQDLIVVEAHVRDLTDRAPIKLSPAERRGFAGLRKWVQSPDFYLHHLGVNAVELQPVQEFDNRTPEEYHWGYMTNNFFALEGSYSVNPLRASAIQEFRELVDAFHARGIAVVLDVVYNHVGEPAHLLFIDKQYYFETDTNGELLNWSGCGNDLRASSAMSTRLIIDSMTYLIETFGIDGFRVDLAELLGIEVLREVEKALKRVKPDVVLIAEPWSFRGHIAGALRETGWASWNDGYRNFLRDYVRGGGTRENYEYFLKGSPWHFAKWPAQTVNYVESHDDKTWLDVITENTDGNGDRPTANDRRRTHLMAAILFSSIGIPMISAGQDFLRSKQGVNNTYQRGDLNALDYRRIFRFPSTHMYFADWIAFRRSDEGRLFRQYSRPSEGFFRFFFAASSTAAVTLYNADRSQGRERLLFAVNPTLEEAVVTLNDDVADSRWTQRADQEHFFTNRPAETMQPVEKDLFIPPLSCALWIEV